MSEENNKRVAADASRVFVAAPEGAGGPVYGTVEKKRVYASADESDDDMPLPSDPKTVFLGGLFGIAVLTVMHIAAAIVLPLVLAIVLKLLLQPLVRLGERIRIPRALGAALALLLLLVVVGATISALAAPAASWAAKLPEAIPRLRDGLGFLKGPINAGQHLMQQVQGLIGGGEGSAMAGIKPSGVLTAVLGSTAAATSGFFTTLLILFYMLVSGETFLRRVVEILPRFQDKRNAVELSFHVERDVSAYLLTITCINLVVGVLTGCDMWLCGVANPVLWGALAFVLNYVPFLGPMTGIVVFLMASVVSLGVNWGALLPVGLFLCIHIAEGEIITPHLLARRFTINPVAVILALIFWFWLWGVPGAILAVPMLAMTKIVCDDIRPLRAVGHLLEG